jgi:hypothetical protein
VNPKLIIVLSLAALGYICPPAFAQYPDLPYTTRTKGYAGWSSIVKGDNNTVGMAGATIAIPNSIAAMEGNPAGFAMDLGGLGAQINSNNLKDPYTAHGNSDITEFQGGVGTSAPPWGYGITYYSPSTEYVDSSEVSVRELRASIAHLLGNYASIGASLEYVKALRRFGDGDYNGGTLSFQIGGLYKLTDAWVVGASYSPQTDIGPAGAENPDPLGFNQSVKVPSLTSLGIAFVPDRFFKFGAALILVGGLDDTALLSDQTIAYGQSFTIEPRVGASYIIADYQNFKIELAMGSYYEESRVQGASNRFHGTFGLDLNPYFINTGVGTDIASGYKNWVASVGIDLVRTARTFGIIPKDTVPPYDGFFPPPFHHSPDGLPDGFTIGQTKTNAPPNVSDVENIVTGIPDKMVEKFGTPQQIAEAKKNQEIEDAKKAAAEKAAKKPVKKPRHRKKKRVPAQPTPAIKTVQPPSGNVSQ